MWKMGIILNKFGEHGAVSVGKWMGILIMAQVPIIGLIAAIVISASPDPTFRNYGKAMMVYGVIGLAFMIIYIAMIWSKLSTSGM
jgi:hypothetical protein